MISHTLLFTWNIQLSTCNSTLSQWAPERCSSISIIHPTGCLTDADQVLRTETLAVLVPGWPMQYFSPKIIIWETNADEGIPWQSRSQETKNVFIKNRQQKPWNSQNTKLKTFSSNGSCLWHEWKHVKVKEHSSLSPGRELALKWPSRGLFWGYLLFWGLVFPCIPLFHPPLL